MAIDKPKSKKLYRSKINCVLGGVAGGLGEFFDIDPTVFRLLFLVSFFFGGAGIFIYIVMWLVVPIDGSKGIVIDENSIRQGADEMKNKANKFKEDADTLASSSNSKKLIGLVLVVLGVVVLLQNIGIFRLFDYVRFWPIVLIIFGVYLLSKKN